MRRPSHGFRQMVDKMAKFDYHNQFVTHVGGGLFAGVRRGEFLGQRLFAA
jgi:hypothetical protein